MRSDYPVRELTPEHLQNQGYEEGDISHVESMLGDLMQYLQDPKIEEVRVVRGPASRVEMEGHQNLFVLYTRTKEGREDANKRKPNTELTTDEKMFNL